MPIVRLGKGQTLYLLVPRPSQLLHGLDHWHQDGDIDAVDTGLGQYAATLPTTRLVAGARIDFTVFWNDEARCEGRH